MHSSHASRIARRALSTAPKLQNEFPNHYATLRLPPSASQAEIKTQFYALSKQHHPDRNPADPHASTKFVQISEAYHALGSATNRAKYDRDFARAHGGTAPTPRGSHSSHAAAGPAGSRPPSGLSRRRGAFRGPPPSFYAQGAYGAHAARRPDAGQHAADRPAAGTPPAGGFEPGRHHPGFEHDPDLLHWDRAGHARTHAGLGSRRAEARRRNEARWAEAEALEAGGSILFNFLMVGGIVVLIGVVPMMILAKGENAVVRKTEKRGDKVG